MPSTDPMAATVAENAICDLLQRRVADNEPWQDPRHTARAIVDQFYVTFEHEDGKRRVVLTGPLEVVPSVSRQPLFAAAKQA
jgi:hypothetical protein